MAAQQLKALQELEEAKEQIKEGSVFRLTATPPDKQMFFVPVHISSSVAMKIIDNAIEDLKAELSEVI